MYSSAAPRPGPSFSPRDPHPAAVPVHGRRRAWRHDSPAGIGRATAAAVQAVSVVNAVIFMVAVVFTMTRDIVVAEALVGVGHWHTSERSLVIVDHTGDPEWEHATRSAVAVWNQAGADVRLAWTRGRGPCGPDGNRIHVCASPHRVLKRVGVPGLEGLTIPDAGSGDHYGSSFVKVCADCGLGPERALVVAIHEVGHVLGLEHTRDVESVMHPSGGSGQPTDRDFSDLRARYLHADGE